ncbi:MULTISPECIES: DUF262 domain-containing protein [Shewanella]|uniref:DUF262 domain-containing protein n=1 Tax=Shewanella TaxID=22 RepID=UPI00200DDA29|nr:DUF262 domain-containing protein [Shewanella kaireitica]MCL1096173.1 DUF262 domain-containing protein [Shewanella kaireitica]
MTLFKRESNTISLATFWENYQLKKYNFEPGYQRDSIWSTEKQSFLIDSILKNIPIPPIFLHLTIDDSTGKTSFAVIDGKQRLTSIIAFIKGEITSSSDGDDSPLYVENLAGIEFKDLDKEIYRDIRRDFWRYSIPIEYIDSDDKETIDAIFDRLNRNGEPLQGQELRRASYYGTNLLNFIENMSKEAFWQKRLANVDVKRMEDREFISEILFYLLEGTPLKSDQAELDLMYKKYKDIDINNRGVGNMFIEITAYLDSLNVDYEQHKVSGVSHLYALWGLSLYCLEHGIDKDQIKMKLAVFYTGLRADVDSNQNFLDYKKSMASSTRMKGPRVKRVSALKEFLEI